jgi:uncharacterized glyoxalase superfamily protein PhnB
MKAKKTNYIPKGYHSLTPFLMVSEVGKAIDFYKKAFGAEELSRLQGPGGTGVMHAELKIGDSIFMLGQCPEGSTPKSEGTACMIHIYVEDVDKAFERAQSAGAQVKMAVEDMFWGDRFGTLTDPFGHEWSLATHIEDVPPEQMQERAEAFFSKTAKH